MPKTKEAKAEKERGLWLDDLAALEQVISYAEDDLEAHLRTCKHWVVSPRDGYTYCECCRRKLYDFGDPDDC
jgi:hypothetical protein